MRTKNPLLVAGSSSTPPPLYIRFETVFTAIHQRAHGQGRSKVHNLVQDAFRLAYQQIKREPDLQKQLEIFSDYLRDENAAKHPRYTDPHAYKNHDDTYRLTIDRLQALIAYCIVSGNHAVPHLIASGNYEAKVIDANNQNYIITLISGTNANINGKTVYIAEYCDEHNLSQQEITKLASDFNYFEKSNKIVDTYRLGMIQYCKANHLDPTQITAKDLAEMGRPKPLSNLLSQEGFDSLIRNTGTTVNIDSFCEALTEVIKAEQLKAFSFIQNLYQLSCDAPQPAAQNTFRPT